MAQTALILGPSGKIGRHFANALARRGWEVRPYARGTDMAAAARGCDLIVNGLNPPNYHNWAVLIPEITAQVIAAAKASGARVIVPGNVYVYGDQKGPWDETTPHKPVAKKGEIRAAMEAEYRAAASAGVKVIMLHSGDFIDPDSKTDAMSLVMLREVAKGKVTAPGQPDVKRAYVYLPDLAEVAAQLAERQDLPDYIDVPVPGLTFSARDLAGEVQRQTGRAIRLGSFPWWMLRLTAPFWELARELVEMRYLFETPHELSGKRLAGLLPHFAPTPFETVVRAVLAKQGMAIT